MLSGRKIQTFVFSFFFSFLIFPAAFCQVNTCNTWTFQIKLGTTSYNEKATDICVLPHDNYIVAGIVNNNTGNADNGLIVKLNKQGTILWSKTLSLSNYEIQIKKIKFFISDQHLYLIGDAKNLSSNIISPFFSVLDTLGNILSSKMLTIPGVSGSWTGVDIDEWRENSFSVVISNDSLIHVARLSLSLNIIWSKTFRAKNSPQVVGIKNNYWETNVAYNESDSGYKKGCLLDIDYNTGNFKYSSKVGGAADGYNYVLQSLTKFNDWPRLTAIQYNSSLIPSFIRLNSVPGGAFSSKETFSITSLSPTQQLTSSENSLCRAIVCTNGNNTDLFVTNSFPDNYNYPITAHKISLGTAAAVTSINATHDGGNIIALNSFASNSDILIVKTDSISSQPGCASIPIPASFSYEAVPRSVDTLQSTNYNLAMTGIAPAASAYIIDTATYCRAVYCPSVGEPDTCLGTFFKEYRDYLQANLFFNIQRTNSNKLFVTGSGANDPYATYGGSRLVLFDTTGKIEMAKTIVYDHGSVIQKLIRLQDNNFIAAGYIYYADAIDSIEQFVMKLDPQLNLIWQKRYVINPALGQVFDIIESSEGDLYCYLDDRLFSAFNAFEKRYILKLNSTGDPVWLKAYDAVGPNYFWGTGEQHGLIADLPGAIVIKYNQESNNRAPILIKINKTDGSVQWVKRFQISDSTSFMAFNFYNLNNQLYLFAAAAQNVVMMKISSDGELLLSKTLDIYRGSTIDVKQKGSSKFILSLSPANFPDFITGVVEVDTSFMVTNKQFYRCPGTAYTSAVVSYNDSISYVVGNLANGYGYLGRSFLQKYNFNGLPGICTTDIPVINGTMPVTVIPETTIANLLPNPQLGAFNAQVEDDMISYSGFYCNGNPGCSLISLTGPSAICDSNNVYTYYANKNSGCLGAVQWLLDTTNNQVTVIVKTDSLMKILAKQNGSFKIKSKLFGACNWLEDSITVTVNILHGALNLGPDTSLCPGNTMLLTAHSGYTNYLWQDNSTDSTFSVTTPGTFFVRTTDACGNIFRDTVVVTAGPPISFDLGPDLSKCNTDSIFITAPAGFIHYDWTPNYNINTTTGQNIILFPNLDTIYHCTAEKTPGCFAYDSIQIIVHHSQPIDLGADTSFCSGNSLLLNAGTGFQQYAWSTGATTQQITVQSSGSYSVIGTDNNNCKSYDTLRILNIYNNPIVTLPKDSVICTGTNQILNAGNGFVNYLWNTGNISQTITVNAIGNYWVSVTDNHGCKGSDTTRITRILPSPVNFLPPDDSICNYSTLQLTTLSSFPIYLWSNGATTKTIQITQAGTYWLQVTDNNDCVGKDTIILNPKQCLEGFYIPSAFTPNRDGKNDVFRPLLFGKVVKFKFTIYNRWGNKVFETNVLQKGWDGKVDGKDTDTNVFVWLCTYQFEGQSTKTEKGTVVLIR